LRLDVSPASASGGFVTGGDFVLVVGAAVFLWSCARLFVGRSR
jgi:hypothetical protein